VILAKVANDLLRRAVGLSAVLAAAAFAVVWVLSAPARPAEKGAQDVLIYQRWGEQIVDGRVPYRDVKIDYPPAAVPAFVAPASVGADGARAFLHRFELLMLACGIGGVLVLGALLDGLGVPPADRLIALAFAAALPALLAPLLHSRFDLWPTLLVLGSLLAAIRRRHGLAGALAGAAVAAKGYPAILVPLLAIWAWREGGRRSLVRLGIAFGAVLVAIVVPFAIAAGVHVLYPVREQLGRPLQIESSGAAALIALHHVLGWTAEVASGSGSNNLVNYRADLLAHALPVLQAAALVFIYVSFARTPRPTAADLAQASAASVAAFIALGKVLSPQFLIWLVPLTLCVTQRRRPAIAVLLVVVLLTHQLYPGRYHALVDDLDGTASAILAARDALLVVLMLLLIPWRRAAAPAARQRVERRHAIRILGRRPTDGA
jgi:hypothetical protein